jgi:hypothetical protein
VRVNWCGTMGWRRSSSNFRSSPRQVLTLHLAAAAAHYRYTCVRKKGPHKAACRGLIW